MTSPGSSAEVWRTAQSRRAKLADEVELRIGPGDFKARQPKRTVVETAQSKTTGDSREKSGRGHQVLHHWVGITIRIRERVDRLLDASLNVGTGATRFTNDLRWLETGQCRVGCRMRADLDAGFGGTFESRPVHQPDRVTDPRVPRVPSADAPADDEQCCEESILLE